MSIARQAIWDSASALFEAFTTPAARFVRCTPKASKLRRRAKANDERGWIKAAGRKLERAQWWEDRAAAWLDVIRAQGGA